MLQDVLVYLKALTEYYKTAHWQCKGQSFYEDHLLLDRLSSEASVSIDTVAEKMLGIGVNPESLNLPEILKKQYEIVKGLPYNSPEGLDYFQAATMCENKLLEICKTIDSSSQSSVGVKNLVAQIADDTEGRIYLLKQRLNSKK